MSQRRRHGGMVHPPIQQLMGQTHRLVVFDAVFRTDSFTRAAKSLGISQPAVSRQIALLEGELQCQLFRRERHQIVPTSAGRALHGHVQNAFRELAAGVAEIRGHTDSLRLAVQPAIADSWFSPRLESLRESLRPTNIELVIFDRDDELTTLEHDISIRFGEGFGRGLRSEFLVEESVAPVASPELAREFGLKTSSVAKELLDGPPLLRLDPSGRQWLTWHDWFAGNRLQWEPPENEIMHRSYGMLVQQALSGRGVLLGWRTLLGDLIPRGMLVPVGPAVRRANVGYHIVWPKGLSRHEGLARLLEWISSTVDGLGTH